jgi:hypothetical protein
MKNRTPLEGTAQGFPEARSKNRQRPNSTKGAHSMKYGVDHARQNRWSEVSDAGLRFAERERMGTDRKARRAGIASGRWARAGMSALGGAVLLLSGCSSSPSRNILGSYFPSWMICALVGMGATVALRVVLAKLSIDGELPIPIVTYLSFATAVSLGMWLLWLA